MNVKELSPEQYLVYCCYDGTDVKTNMGKDRYIDVEYDTKKDKYYLWIMGDENLTTNMTKATYLSNATDVFNKIFTVAPDKIGNKDVDIVVCGELVDPYGKTSIEHLVQVSLNADIVDKIVWDTFDYNNLLDISTKYWLHDIFKDN